MNLIDPHYPRLITRRAARNLVAEHPNVRLPAIDCTNVEKISEEYFDTIALAWQDVRFVNTQNMRFV